MAHAKPQSRKGAKGISSSILCAFAPLREPPLPSEGCCTLFADGLRYDVGQRLLAEIVDRGWQVEASWSWVPAPSVTATAKPAVSLVAGLLGGDPAEDAVGILTSRIERNSPDLVGRLLLQGRNAVEEPFVVASFLSWKDRRQDPPQAEQ